MIGHRRVDRGNLLVELADVVVEILDLLLILLLLRLGPGREPDKTNLDN